MDPMAKFFWTLWTSEISDPVEDDTDADNDVVIEGPEEPEEAEKEDTEPTGNTDFRENIIGRSIKSAQAGKIEIQTADGKIFTPLEFYEDKSLSRIGYFEALDEKERLITLVIRWENVVRIVVKK